MNLYLGFDPGGKTKKEFGWAVCEANEQILTVRHKGRVENIQQALNAVKEALSKITNTEQNIIGAGIDAPLVWGEMGVRAADQLIREEIHYWAKSPGGTTQEINSLRGACLAQGILLARLLHKNYPGILITESHPKALLYLFRKISNNKKPKSALNRDEIPEKYVRCEEEILDEHERDAILGAFTAFARTEKLPGWGNILSLEEKSILVTPFDYQAEYWMPLQCFCQPIK